MAWAFNIEVDGARDAGGLFLGQEDGSCQDMFGLRESDGALRRYTQAPFIGVSGKKAAYHSYAFTNVEPGQYRILYSFVNKENTYHPGACPLRNADVLDLRTQPGEWYVDVLIRGTDALLTIDSLFTDQDAEAQPHALIDSIRITRLKNAEVSKPLEVEPSDGATSSSTEGDHSALFGLFSRPYSAQSDLDRYLQPFQGEDLAALDGYLAEALDGVDVESLSPESLCIWLLSYVSQTMTLAKAHTGAYALNMGTGNCYFRALALCALCKRSGIPARPVVLWESRLSHVVADVYYDDAWHQFDPTYGCLFYSRSEYDGQGLVPSARQLRTEPSALDYCLRVDAPIWSGDYVRTTDMIPMTPDYIPPNYTGTGGVPILQYLRNMFWKTNSWGPEFGGRTMSYPIQLDFASRLPVTFGLDNQNPYDSVVIYTGACYHIGCVNTFTFSGYTPGRYHVHYDFMDKSRAFQPGVLALRGLSVLSTSSVPGEWSVDLHVYEEGASFLLDVLQDELEYKNPSFKAVDSVHISPVDTFQWTVLPQPPVVDITQPVELEADYVGTVGSATLQWYRDGMPILGAEDRVLELEPTSPKGLTGKYTLQVMDGTGVHETPPVIIAPEQVSALSWGICVLPLSIALLAVLRGRFRVQAAG